MKLKPRRSIGVKCHQILIVISFLSIIITSQLLLFHYLHSIIAVQVLNKKELRKIVNRSPKQMEYTHEQG